MSIMITGGTGFLGSHLARYLLDEVGERDVLLFEQSPVLDRIEDILDRVTIVQGDVLEPTSIVAAMKEHNVDRVVHLAFILTVGSYASTVRSVNVNCSGTANVFEAARIMEVSRVVYASSAAVYGHREALGDEEHDEDITPEPSSLYGAAKLFNEHLADTYFKQYGLDTIGLRPTSVFGLGRGQRVTSPRQHFMVQPELAAVGRKAVMPPDDQIVDWMYVADAAAAWHCALTAKDPPHRVFNMASERRPVGDCTRYVRAALPDSEIEVAAEPFGALRLVSNRRLREELGFTPRFTLETGYADYLNTVRARAGMGPVAAATP